MERIGKLSGSRIQRAILESIEIRSQIQNGRIVSGDTLVFPADESCIFSGFWVNVISKYGQKVVDGGIKIYWDDFWKLDSIMSFECPYPMDSLNRWEMAAVVSSFDRINKDWPSGGFVLPEGETLEGLLNVICDFYLNDGKKFLDKYASVAGILSYLVDGDFLFRGTWRPTLEFLARKKMFGACSACKHLRESYLDEPTPYEKYQREWILRKCCSDNG